MSDGDMVEVCPADECGSSRIYKLTRSMSGSHPDHDKDYTCRSCGERFDYPDERPRLCDRDGLGDSLAADLAAADPDEVSAS